MEARDFDEWRERYDSMTFEEHAAFYRRLHADHPDQSFFDAEGVKKLIGAIGEHLTVMELGGHDGGLAGACLSESTSIVTWGNYEIAPEPPCFKDHRYHDHILFKQLWEEGIEWRGTLFVASHVLEHLSEGDVWKLLRWLPPTAYLFIDAPLEARGDNGWMGATAAHKLEWTWDQLEEALSNSGYTRVPLDSSGRAYRLLS